MTKHTLKILGCEHRKIFKVCLTILQHYAWKGWLRISVPVNSCTIYFTARKVFLRYFVFLLFNMRGSHYPVGKTWSWVYLSNWFDNFFIFLDISCNVIGPIFFTKFVVFLSKSLKYNSVLFWAMIKINLNVRHIPLRTLQVGVTPI